jgi:pullulanase
MRSWHFNHIDFSTYPHYAGEDLGIGWSEEKTVFRIWAPTARIVELRLFASGKTDKPIKTISLSKAEQGTWYHEIPGNLEGIYYTFKINDGEWYHETPDPWAKAVGINGFRGMITDLSKTNPEGWESDHGPRLPSFTDWIIYETHIRDFSISESSGIKNKGKYAGFTEENTFSPLGEKSGLSHLLELGITHIHLLPVNDFQTIDDEFPLLKYNWGYDPQNFNTPEGSYSSDPFDGSVRIRELKQLIRNLHIHKIGVVLDVVYNHTWLTKGSVFNQTVPGYFYRQNPDGTFSNASGCGNEIASERSMVRKYIIDSLKYWIREYHIDGFRFDLMGIFDSETMRHIHYEISRIDPTVFLYGEGWTAGQSPMPEFRRAVKKNISHLQGIAAFNDDLRDALKGNHGYKTSLGFVSGLSLREEAVKFGIVAATWHPQIVYPYVESSVEPWAEEPGQCVNYVSCHDNFTLFDKLSMSLPTATDEELQKMVMLAGAIILTSQGVPFLHSGQEFCRTKNGNSNSYKAPDAVNQLDWLRKSTYKKVVEYYRNLISLRKNHPLFRMPASHMIRENLNFCTDYKTGVVSYCLKGAPTGDSWEQAILFFNGNRETVTAHIPREKFRIIAKEGVIEEKGIETTESDSISVPPVSMVLLAR